MSTGAFGVERPEMAFNAAAIGEGFCPYGHGPLTPVRLHGEDTGACLACGCSWRCKDGVRLGVACVPGRHHCGADAGRVPW